MKARILLMMLALIVATASACSSGSETTKKDDAATTKEMAQTEKADEAGEEDGAEAADDEAEATAEADARDQMEGKKGMMQHCPMALEGTEVAAENTDAGVAMVFTNADNTDQLRERIQWMAEHHNKMMQGGHGKMKGHAKMKGQAKMNGKKGMMHKGMPKATVKAEQVEGGMKLVFTAEDKAQVQTLQQHMAQHVERVQSGTCPMKYNKSADAKAEEKADEKADEATGEEAQTDEGKTEGKTEEG